MSSRQEEKERRRQERLAAEKAASGGSDARKRFGIVGAVVLVVAVAVIVVIAVAGGGEDGAATPAPGASIPDQQIDNLNEAVRASGCTLETHEIEGSTHTAEDVTYNTNPPTSGDHDPTPAEDGIYDPGNSPDIEQSVHSLEHGRINYQYKPGTPQENIDQLVTLASESVKGEEGYHTLLFENQTEMEPALAATAWGRSLTCDEFTPQVWDALRAFRRDRVDKAPEFIP